MIESMKHGGKPSNTIPWWVKSILLLSISGVICYKLLITPFNLQFDFPSFLSLLLALFSVALAAMFYFKATDTSNAFYDNTYKFSQEIASLLMKIESGFGEKLSHLDDAYKGMRERFDQLPNRLDSATAKKDLKQEEKELEKIVKDREELINELVNKAQLQEGEKQKFLEQLKEKERALLIAHEEITFLKDKLIRDRHSNKANLSLRKNVYSEEIGEIIHYIIRSIGGPEYVLEASTERIVGRFRRIINELSNSVKEMLIRCNIITLEGSITENGISVIKDKAKKILQ